VLHVVNTALFSGRFCMAYFTSRLITQKTKDYRFIFDAAVYIHIWSVAGILLYSVKHVMNRPIFNKYNYYIQS
jgi:hypothetical protein